MVSITRFFKWNELKIKICLTSLTNLRALIKCRHSLPHEFIFKNFQNFLKQFDWNAKLNKYCHLTLTTLVMEDSQFKKVYRKKYASSYFRQIWIKNAKTGWLDVLNKTNSSLKNTATLSFLRGIKRGSVLYNNFGTTVNYKSAWILHLYLSYTFWIQLGLVIRGW